MRRTHSVCAVFVKSQEKRKKGGVRRGGVVQLMHTQHNTHHTTPHTRANGASHKKKKFISRNTRLSVQSCVRCYLLTHFSHIKTSKNRQQKHSQKLTNTSQLCVFFRGAAATGLLCVFCVCVCESVFSLFVSSLCVVCSTTHAHTYEKKFSHNGRSCVHLKARKLGHAVDRFRLVCWEFSDRLLSAVLCEHLMFGV